MAWATLLLLAIALPLAGPAAAAAPLSWGSSLCGDDADGAPHHPTWLLQLGLSVEQRHAQNATAAPPSLIAGAATVRCEPRGGPRHRGRPKAALAWGLAGSMAAVFGALLLAALLWDCPHFAFLASACLAAGVGSIVVKDLMANTTAPTVAGGPERGFNYPSLGNLSTYLGMTLFFPLQLLLPQSGRRALGEKRPPTPRWALVVVMLLHYLSLGLVNYAYRLLPGSLIQMLQSSRVVFTGLLGYMLLGRAVQGQEVLGMALALMGVTVAGIGTAEARAAAHGVACDVSWAGFCLGVGLVLLSELVRSLLFLFQEVLLRRFAVTPMRLTGCIGALGLALSAPVLLAAQLLGLEDLRSAAYQLLHSRLLALAFLTFLLVVAMFEYVGISVTSRSNASVRAMLELMRVALVWFLEVLVGWNSFTLLQAGGFTALVLGSLVDCRLLTLPRQLPAAEEQLPKEPQAS